MPFCQESRRIALPAVNASHIAAAATAMDTVPELVGHWGAPCGWARFRSWRGTGGHIVVGHGSGAGGALGGTLWLDTVLELSGHWGAPCGWTRFRSSLPYQRQLSSISALPPIFLTARIASMQVLQLRPSIEEACHPCMLACVCVCV